MSAFLLCFAAWSAIALSMDRHREDALGREAAAAHRPQQLLRRAGWLVLALSLWLAARPEDGAPASLGVTAWTIALSVAAVAVTALMTWQPRRAPVLAGVALAAGLAAWAAGW